MSIRLSAGLSRAEVSAVLAELRGGFTLIALLLYGAGLRLGEGLALRVKDIDTGQRQITVRRGKGQKDRVTMLPEAARVLLGPHLAAVRTQHEQDVRDGVGAVVLPEALARKAVVARWSSRIFLRSSSCRVPRGILHSS